MCEKALKMDNKKKILIASSGASSLNGFRLPLIKHWRALGYEVVATACEDSTATAKDLEAVGVKFVPIPVGRASLNPFADVSLVLRMAKLMRRERIDVAFLFQQKAVIYGGLAAKLAGIRKTFAMVTGLGYAFTESSGLKYKIVNKVASLLYRFSVKCFDGMIFQNPDDMEFVQKNFLKRSRIPLKRVYGSGVGLDDFSYSSDFDKETFLFIGRLVANKGIREYIDAGKILTASGKTAEFRILGGLDVNPTAITKTQLDEWEGKHVCRYLGTSRDVRPIIRSSAVFVLPSYYGEGTPRSALEAMAIGRPVIVANTPGCREVVFFEKACRRYDWEGGKFVDLPLPVNSREHEGEILMGDNGFLVPAKNAEALAVAMKFYLENPESVLVHGRESRRLAEKYYDVNDVNRQITEFVSLAPESSKAPQANFVKI